MARNPASMIVRDPVCGIEIDEPRTVTQAEFDGKLFYFCSHECCKRFKADPAPFVPTAYQRQTHHYSKRLHR